MRFHDRIHAGATLAQALKSYDKAPDTFVWGLPRGGVPVANQVARELSLPLDVFVVRKLGVPWHKELAMGAIAEGDFKLLNRHLIDELAIDDAALEEVFKNEHEELERRRKLLRGRTERPSAKDKTIILVDDGLATGATMKVAIAAIRTEHPKKIVVAVPVSPIDTAREIKDLADEFVCLSQPESFWGVGGAYEQFPQLTDHEVIELLS